VYAFACTSKAKVQLFRGTNSPSPYIAPPSLILAEPTCADQYWYSTSYEHHNLYGYSSLQRHCRNLTRLLLRQRLLPWLDVDGRYDCDGIWEDSKIRENGGDGVQRSGRTWTNNLWKRIIKNVIATTVVGMPPFSRLYTISADYSWFPVGICLIPGARNALGRAAYLAPITTVFGHPGRRFGMMAEALILALGVQLSV
jgi:hypothetical protein